jgi:hypothetical protein
VLVQEHQAEEALGPNPGQNRAVAILQEAAGVKVVSPREMGGEGSGEERARRAQARQNWAEGWTAQRQEFSLKNPDAPR